MKSKQHRSNLLGSYRWHAATSLAGLLLAATPAGAVDFNWQLAAPAVGNWSNGAHWNPAGPPSGGGGNHALINNGGTAVISADIGDIQDIFVGVGVGTSGTLSQTGGNTFQGTGSWMFVGQDGGTGVYNLSGGTQDKGRLYIGRGNGGDGTLNLSGTGTVDNEMLIVGEGGGSTGHVSVMGNGSVSASSEIWFGNAGGVATADITSGAVESEEWIAIGRDSGTGTVNLSGTGRLAKIGVDDKFITLGALGAGGGGTLNIADSAVLESDTGLVLSETAGRYGVVNQTGGTVTLHDFVNPLYGKSLHVDYAGGGLGEYHLAGGTLNAETIDATTGVFDMTGGVLSAITFEGDLIQNGGTTSPGSSPGIMTVMGNYALNSGSLLIELMGLTAGTGYDQLVVTGDVSLAGSLDLLLGFIPSINDMFTIIDNQGPNAVIGSFLEGVSLTVGGFDFSIDYQGGDGNDVVLTVVGIASEIAEPSAVLLLPIGIAALAARVRRRRAAPVRR